MLMPRPDPVYVRASVADKCNLNCVYCPKREGMENRVPDALRGRRLSLDEYCQNMGHIARNGITGISFTGGEPTLNPDLVALIRHAASTFDRVELTSNGFHLLGLLPSIAPYLNLLKISLDSTDETVNSSITRGPSGEAAKAQAAIIESCRLGLRVGVNIVVMRSALAEIEKVLAFCRAVNQLRYTGKAYVSLLDFYYSSEQRVVWEREFLSVDDLASTFETRYGPRIVQERFGCSFYWFDAHGVELRIKSSLGATHRAGKCKNCKHYCQEGIYGLKHSVEGWITTCPNGEPSYGAYLKAGLTNAEADDALYHLIQDIHNATPDRDSFATLIGTHALNPTLCLDDRPLGHTTTGILKVIK